MKLSKYINKLGMARLALRRQMLSVRSSGHISDSLGVGKGVILSYGTRLTCGAGYIGADVHFDIGPGAEVAIGENVWISRGGHICSANNIKIGNDVMIGEFTSIRDATHGHERLDVPMLRQANVIGSVQIDSDVWIGRGCLIQSQGKDIVLGMGCIVAANSVVTASIPPYEIWGGSPARRIRERASS